MYKVRSEGKFEITGRGVSYSIKDQGVTVGDMKHGEEIEIDGKVYIIKGVESFAIAEPSRSQLTQFAILTDEPTKEMKRQALKKEQWIKNVIRIQGHTREEAEKLYNKINSN